MPSLQAISTQGGERRIALESRQPARFPGMADSVVPDSIVPASVVPLVAQALDKLRWILRSVILCTATFWTVLAAWVRTGSAAPSPCFLNCVVARDADALSSTVANRVREDAAGWLGNLQRALGGALLSDHVDALADGAGKLMGTVAAAATSEEDLARTVGATTVAGLQLATDHGISVRTDICFVRGPLVVVRAAVEAVDTHVLCTKMVEGGMAPAGLDEAWRQLLAAAAHLSPRLERAILGLASTAVAFCFARLLLRTLPEALEISLLETSGLRVRVTARSAAEQACQFFDTLDELAAVQGTSAGCRASAACARRDASALGRKSSRTLWRL